MKPLLKNEVLFENITAIIFYQIINLTQQPKFLDDIFKKIYIILQYTLLNENFLSLKFTPSNESLSRLKLIHIHIIFCFIFYKIE
jgi:hypothetical protein